MKVIEGTDIRVPIESMDDLKKACDHYYCKEGKIYGGAKEAYWRGFLACKLFWVTVHPVVEEKIKE